jgi:hypothetical protein
MFSASAKILNSFHAGSSAVRGAQRGWRGRRGGGVRVEGLMIHCGLFVEVFKSETASLYGAILLHACICTTLTLLTICVLKTLIYLRA